MLERLKFWRGKESSPVHFAEFGGVKYFSKDEKMYRIEGDNMVEVNLVSHAQGDGKAEFLGEGTEQEFKDQQNDDKGLKGVFGLGK